MKIRHEDAWDLWNALLKGNPAFRGFTQAHDADYAVEPLNPHDPGDKEFEEHEVKEVQAVVGFVRRWADALEGKG
jgi:hypothetical protein